VLPKKDPAEAGVSNLGKPPGACGVRQRRDRRAGASVSGL